MKNSLQKKATGEPHLVPLADAAASVLREIEPLTAHGPLVFPGQRGQGRCISENSARQALRTMGYGNDDHNRTPLLLACATFQPAIECGIQESIEGSSFKPDALRFINASFKSALRSPPRRYGPSGPADFAPARGIRRHCFSPECALKVLTAARQDAWLAGLAHRVPV
jgi:hypothetical protein